jgi:hypothetical protein
MNEYIALIPVSFFLIVITISILMISKNDKKHLKKLN